MRTALIALLLLPLAASAQQPTTEQKEIVQSITALGRVQAACSLYNSELLHPGITKRFIETQFKALPDGGKQLRTVLLKEDPKCSKALN